MNNEGKVVKVMTDEEWAGLSEQSRQNLITLFSYNQFPAPDASIHSVKFNEGEQKVLHEAMALWDMSAGAVIRHFFRMGQMMNTLLRDAEGSPLGYLDDQGDFHAPFYTGPKMAPMPECTCEQTDGRSCPIPLHQPAVDSWENEGGS
jgi:hypothetical protein